MPPADLISVTAAAARLGVDENTVYRWIASEDRPQWVLKIGKRWRVSVPLLEAAIGAATTPVPVLTDEIVLKYLEEHPHLVPHAVERVVRAVHA